ncbi:MAG: hypothetical protein JSS43_17655, partial [Proteobacteria bacterium]|nr:hypothetical protein [Pseudomonadota bacterium]
APEAIAVALDEIAFANKVDDAITKFLLWAARFGIAINPVPFSDFKDPDVQVWNNLSFIDNYYQLGAKQNAPTDPLSQAVNVLIPIGYTATPNGRSIPSADINKNLDRMAGFGVDDFFDAIGVGGPHSRVWSWYTGTINTAIKDFGGPIFRSIGDQGMYAVVMGIPIPPVAGGISYSTTPWYFSDPAQLVAAGGNRFVAASAQVPTGAARNYIDEGITTGWYYSYEGGGLVYRPQNTVAKTKVEQDNTEVTKGPTAVPTVFNGNFENGTRQSLLSLFGGILLNTITQNLPIPTWLPKKVQDSIKAALPYLKGKAETLGDYGRFPLSYSLPGWSFQGGTGFKVGLPDIGLTTDVTGLFVFQTDPAALFGVVVKQLFSNIVDNVITALITKVKNDTFGIPKKPDATAPQSEIDAWNAKWGPNSINAAVIGMAEFFWKSVDKIYNRLVQGDLGTAPQDPANPARGTLADWFEIDGNKNINPAGLDGLKTYLTAAFQLLLKDIFGTGSNYALLMGGEEMLKSLIQTFFPQELADFANYIISKVADMNSVTHDRLYVPTNGTYLNFDISAPAILTPDAKIDVIFTPWHNGVEGTPITETVDLTASFFERQHLSVIVPAALKGQMITLTFKHHGMQETLDTVVFPGDTNIGGLSNAISQLYFLDNIAFSATPTQGTPLQSNADEPVTMAVSNPAGLSVAQLGRILDVAKANWINSNLVQGAADKLNGLTVAVTALSDGTLATYENGLITLDATGAGRGWFADLTPGEASEFLPLNAGGKLVALTGTQAEGRYDILTVLEHEIGHMLGLPDVAEGIAPDRLMSAELETGTRFLPSAADIIAVTPTSTTTTTTTPSTPVLTQPATTPAPTTTPAQTGTAVTLKAGDPAPGALGNGGFDVTDPALAGYRWLTTGAVAVNGSKATLSEDSTFNTRLWQDFSLPVGATTITFTIKGGTLHQDAGNPPDVFEMRLLDAITGLPVAGTALGLSGTDALLNLQPDGTLYLASGVSVSGLVGGKLDLSSGLHVVTIDLSTAGITTPVTIEFDLVGFGAQNSSVDVDSVTVLGGGGLIVPPVLSPVPDQTIPEGQTLQVQVQVASSSSPDLTFSILSGPKDATIDAQTGVLTWLAPNGPLAQPISVQVTDGNGLSAIAQFTVNVTDVAPTLSVTAPDHVRRDSPFVVHLGATDPGVGDSVQSWEINWGDGSTSTVAGTATQVSHNFTAAGLESVQVKAIGNDGTFAADPLPVSVDNPASVSIISDRTLKQTGAHTYALNLGNVVINSGSVVAGVTLTNSATGPADLLGGSFVVRGSNAFGNSGFINFGSIAAGGSVVAGTITLAPSALGSFVQTITLTTTDTTPSGETIILQTDTITVSANVVTPNGSGTGDV